jgi:hypothetical protein
MTHPSSSTGGGPAPGPARDAARPSGPAGLGVPLSVWPGLPAPGSAPDGLPCGGPVTAAAAGRVIELFSRPGDLVAADSGSPAVAGAAAAAGRAVLALVSDGRRVCPLAPSAALIRLGPGGPLRAIAAGNPVTGQVTLAVAGRHGPGCCPAPGDDGPGGDDGLLYAACERLLRPGGVLAVITASPDADSPPGSAVAAARAAGLLYAQHIVLLHAGINGERLDPGPAAPGDAAAPGGILVHSDLLVFTKPGGPRP